MTLPTLIPATTTTTETAMGAFMLAVETLQDLPTDRNKIAALFTDIGVRGVPSSGKACVLAEYLRGVVWPDESIEVRVLNGALCVEFGDIELLYNLPNHLREFTFHFDVGTYPELCR